MQAYSGRQVPRSRTAARVLSPVEGALLALVVGVLLCAAVLSTNPRPADLRTTTVQVGAGDSLWEIAQEYPVEGLTTGETVDLLSELNGLENATISAGSSLKVPARATSESVAMR